METSKRILLVDDTKENIDILIGLLHDFDIMVALDGQSAVDTALSEELDLILLDILMPGLDGFETCRILKNNSRTRDIPIIFITAKTDEDSIQKAYETGGVDYVTKPFKPRELLARVRTHLELRSLINYLEHLSSYDQMTGIYNRRKFFELGAAVFADSRENLYAMIMDIDQFKQVNDTYGHPAGDIVIKAVAQAIQDQLGDHSVLGRIGGEEFAVLFHAGSADQAFSRIERIRNRIEELEIRIDNGTELKTTVSGGLACCSGHHLTLDQLLKTADDALYESKGSGRNKSIFRTT